MTNDISTLNGALNELGETLAYNLSEMGIDDAEANDGLTTLAGKILDIEPSISGLNLSTSIDCKASSNDILTGQQVIFSATLSATYDDISIEDIDLSGVLTGATVLFKTNDGAIIGSGVTDINGIASYTHIFEDTGNYNVHAVFEGSNNFDSCNSQSVTVNVNYDLNVSVDKEILSSYDNDTATFTGILTDGKGGVADETINYQVLHEDTVLDSGSLVTDENGEITLEYAATGVGDVKVIFSLRSLLQKRYEVQDCRYWNPNEVTRTSTNGSTIYDNNMSEALPTNCEISFDMWSNVTQYDGQHRFFLLPKSQYNSGTTQPQSALYVDYAGGNYRMALGKRENDNTIGFTGSGFSISSGTYHNIKIVKTGTSIEIFVDDVSKTTQIISWIDNYSDYCFSMMRWSASGTSKMKNVKIKAL